LVTKKFKLDAGDVLDTIVGLMIYIVVTFIAAYRLDNDID